jgi:predicted nucleic acid-binding protein
LIVSSAGSWVAAYCRSSDAGDLDARISTGRPICRCLGAIAAVAAAARKATLATRNTHHFESLGITLVDPWRA